VCLNQPLAVTHLLVSVLLLGLIEKMGRLSEVYLFAQAGGRCSYFSILTELPSPNHFSASALAAFKLISLEWISPTWRPSLL
jgi:hypothetical protein